ncbi:hypothetical protein [Nostoc sp. FACHB-892]|uniref:hypothetical protein n=1 Tax=Nostoc sp. FACHB-892 TaxID=2692843 RepID=UPI001F54C4BE|nr:hypothetical protein [Nostoc sp. FACHB-892]
MLAGFGTPLMAGYILWLFHDYFMRSRQADLDNWTSALSESVADALEEKNIKQVKVLVQRYGAPQTYNLTCF